MLMNTGVVASKSSFQPSTLWETQENVVTHDDVIDAYFKGKNDGRSEQQKVNLRLFQENYERAKSVSEELFNQIVGIGFSITDLHLKADSIVSFNALFIVDKDDFVDENFLKSFSIARTIKNGAEDDTFNIYFTFTPNTSSLDKNCLKHDGFFARYAQA